MLLVAAAVFAFGAKSSGETPCSTTSNCMSLNDPGREGDEKHRTIKNILGQSWIYTGVYSDILASRIVPQIGMTRYDALQTCEPDLRSHQ